MFSFHCHFFLSLPTLGPSPVEPQLRAGRDWGARCGESRLGQGASLVSSSTLQCMGLLSVKTCLNFPPKNRNPSWMVWGFYIFGWWQMGGEEGKPNYMSLIPFTTKKSCVPFFAVGSPKWNLHANPCNSSPLGDVTMLFCPPIGWWIFGILEISGVGILHGWGASFGRNQQTKHVRMVKWEQERKKKIHHQWTDAFPWLNIFQNLSGLFHVGKILAKG